MSRVMVYGCREGTKKRDRSLQVLADPIVLGVSYNRKDEGLAILVKLPILAHGAISARNYSSYKKN